MTCTRNPTPLHLFSATFDTELSTAGSRPQDCGSFPPGGSSESSRQGHRQNDTGDYGRGCSEDDGACASRRDGQKNRNHNGQNFGQSCAGRCVLSRRWNSEGGRPHRNPGSDSADDLEGDSEDSSEDGLWGWGLSCQSGS
jgi:hypothetical protein